jgi:3-oxoadipate enol-lactonase
MMPKIQLRQNFEMNYEVVENCMAIDTLFIHGNLASNTWFYPAAELLKSNNKGLKGRMIMAEWRGCGKSSAPAAESELQMKNLAQDYIDLCEKLSIQKVNVVAHSTGGLMTLLAMAMRPELFSKAFLLDPVGPHGVKFEEPMYDAFTAMSQDRAFCEAVLASTIHNVVPSDSIFQKIVDDTFKVAPLNWHGVPHALENIDFTREVKSVKQAVMIVHGELDPILPLAASQELAQILPNAKFVEAKGHGHSLNIEDPKMFTQMLTDFFKS